MMLNPFNFTAKHPWICAGLLWIALIAVASDSQVISYTGVFAHPRQNTFPLRILGETRKLFSDRFYLQADQTYHKGVGHLPSRAFDDILSKLSDLTAPGLRKHLEDSEIQEILPWLYLAVRLEPQNVTPYLVGVYVLGSKLHRYDLADKLLREAYLHNPRDYRIWQERGRLCLRQGDREAAAASIDSGLYYWPNPLNLEDDQVFLDLAQMQMHRALLAEQAGDLALALELYDAILQKFPGRAGAYERAAALRAGTQPEPSAAILLDNILVHTGYLCDHDHHHEVE